MNGNDTHVLRAHSGSFAEKLDLDGIATGRVFPGVFVHYRALQAVPPGEVFHAHLAARPGDRAKILIAPAFAGQTGCRPPRPEGLPRRQSEPGRSASTRGNSPWRPPAGRVL